MTLKPRIKKYPQQMLFAISTLFTLKNSIVTIRKQQYVVSKLALVIIKVRGGSHQWNAHIAVQVKPEIPND